jgi:tetratricopeptide (TPR) repeat protein
VAETSRIELLRRRVAQDPASIAFAQLAEEYRRAGELEEAVRVARAGLEQHPAYLSARVTLGRALLDLGRHDEAEPELEAVVSVAPDNLAAIRALAVIHQQRGDAPAPEAEPDRVPPASPPPLPLDASAIDALFEAPSAPISPSTPPGPPAPEPALEALEAWHSAILRDRAGRTGTR